MAILKWFDSNGKPIMVRDRILYLKEYKYVRNSTN